MTLLYLYEGTLSFVIENPKLIIVLVSRQIVVILFNHIKGVTETYYTAERRHVNEHVWLKSVNMS